MTLRYGCGLIPDPPGDYPSARALLGGAAGLSRPWSTTDLIDLRPYCPPIQHQGSTLSCTGQAFKGGFEAAQLTAARLPYTQGGAGVLRRVSARGAYTEARYKLYPAGQPLQDAGAMIRDLFDAAMAWGILTEEACPWSEMAINHDPSWTALEGGARQKLAPEAWGRIDSVDDDRVADVLAQLEQGYPVEFGAALPAGYDGVGLDHGPVAMFGTAPDGLHAQLLVGYDRLSGCWLARNSWGTSFGNNVLRTGGVELRAGRGYAWLAPEWVRSHRCFDFTVCKGLRLLEAA